jgi:hypothetical protein
VGSAAGVKPSQESEIGTGGGGGVSRGGGGAGGGCGGPGGCGGGGSLSNAAPTAESATIVTAQSLEPEHAPLHPENFHPALAEADSVTRAAALNLAEQVSPQSIPAGADVTAPDPEGATVSVKL